MKALEWLLLALKELPRITSFGWRCVVAVDGEHVSASSGPTRYIDTRPRDVPRFTRHTRDFPTFWTAVLRAAPTSAMAQEGPSFLLHAFGDLVAEEGGTPHHLLVAGCRDGFIPGLPPPPRSLLCTPASRVWEATLAALEEREPGWCTRICAATAAEVPAAVCSALPSDSHLRLVVASALEPLGRAIAAELARRGRSGVAVVLSSPQRLLPASNKVPPAEQAGFASFSRALAVPADSEHGHSSAVLPVCVGLRCAAAAFGAGLRLPEIGEPSAAETDDSALERALVAAAARSSFVADPAEGPYLGSARQPPLLRVAVTAGLVHPAALWRAARSEAHRCAEAIEHADAGSEGHSVRLTYCVGVLRWLTAREYCRTLVSELQQRRSDRSALLRPELSSLPWAAGASAAAASKGGLTGHPNAPGATSPLTADAREEAFLVGLTGFPLVDAAVRCLRATGSAPVPLCALLSNFYTKYLGLPYSRGAAALQHLRVDTDGSCALVQWQWDTGLSAGAVAAVSVDALDAFHGGEHAPSRASLAARRDLELPLGISGSRAQCWTRWAAALPPHPHCMGHPAAHEFAFDVDPTGAFVRRWLQPGAGSSPVFSGSVEASALWARIGLPTASEVLAGASIYDPGADAAALTSEGAVALVHATGLLEALAAPNSALPESLAAVPSTALLYPRTIVDAAAAREAVLARVRALLARAHPALDLASGAPTTKSPGAVSHASESEIPASPDALREAFASARAEAGYSDAWGAVGTQPLLVEEDLCILERQRVALGGGAKAGPLPESWKEIFYDEVRRLRLFMGDRADSHVRSALGVAVLPRVSPSEGYDAFIRLSKYKTWDFTWRGVRRVGRPLDSINDPYYFLADTPPPPYSYVITQRDFCMFRAVLVRPPGYAGSSAGDAVFYRNGAHASVPPVSSLIRGEALGVVGFTVQPVPVRVAQRPASALVASSGPAVSGQRLPYSGSLRPGPDGGPGASDISESDAAAASPAPALPLALAGVLPDPVVRAPPTAVAAALAPQVADLRCKPGVIVTLATAVDPKGSIPAFLINFVAKRTPRMWVDRLSAGER